MQCFCNTAGCTFLLSLKTSSLKQLSVHCYCIGGWSDNFQGQKSPSGSASIEQTHTVLLGLKIGLLNLRYMVRANALKCLEDSDRLLVNVQKLSEHHFGGWYIGGEHRKDVITWWNVQWWERGTSQGHMLGAQWKVITYSLVQECLCKLGPFIDVACSDSHSSY